MFVTFGEWCQMTSILIFFLLCHSIASYFVLVLSLTLNFIAIRFSIIRSFCEFVFFGWNVDLIREAIYFYSQKVPYWTFHLGGGIFARHTHIQIQIQCVGLQFLSKVQFEMHILSHANERWNDDDAAAIVSHHAVAHSHNQTKSATDWMLAGWVRVRVCLRVCACVYVCESTCKCVRCARALIHIHST